MKRQFVVVCLAACGLLVGCGEPMGPDPLLLTDLSVLPMAEEPLAAGQLALRVAAVGALDDSAIAAVAGAARVGEPVQVRVTTIGGGCVAEDSTVVRVTGQEAVVVPYQKVRTGVVCTADLRINRRVVPVVFSAPGLAVVTVIGRSGAVTVAGRSGPDGHLVKFVRVVVVRP